MEHFFVSYGLFLLKSVSVVVLILFCLIGFLAILSRNKTQEKLMICSLNKKFEAQSKLFFHELSDSDSLRTLKKKTKKDQKRRVFVIQFSGDVRASEVSGLQEMINAVLLVAKRTDEVVLCLESAGGMVHAYGLAAEALCRIKDAGISLTIVVDKIAASGGYLMACVADQLIAAPFSIIGSIGVVFSLPNFHRALKDKHIDFEQVTSGEYKRTLTLLGENTNKGREKIQEEINSVHLFFKEYIRKHRPQVLLETVSNGAHWLGQEALHYGLIDQLGTSDAYLLNAYRESAQLYEVKYHIKKSLSKRVFGQVSEFFDSCVYAIKSGSFK